MDSPKTPTAHETPAQEAWADEHQSHDTGDQAPWAPSFANGRQDLVWLPPSQGAEEGNLHGFPAATTARPGGAEPSGIQDVPLVPSIPPRSRFAAPRHLSTRPGDVQVPVSPGDVELVHQTLAGVIPIADEVTSHFYALLFLRYPRLRGLFPAAMGGQRDRLFGAMLASAKNIDDPIVLLPFLQALGRGHRKHGVGAEHYPAFGECLISAVARYAMKTWSASAARAWQRSYATISRVMIDAAEDDERRTPPWWYGEIVAHELRTPDTAVITLRPDQSYPFLAGQYTVVETPWWPRVWRHYSMASAPRRDGMLKLHVKALPTGWVSNALVHRARPGDVLRLGSSAGSMTVDHTTDRGLLCIAGGTGIAPVKALLEDVIQHGVQRSVEFYYAASLGRDLYELPLLLHLEQVHPWFSVQTLIREQSLVTLPDLIERHGPWNACDVYVSGPPGMIRATVRALIHLGMPRAHIWYDPVDQLIAAGT
ncbi:globin domain-containing protein [Streptomyces sp. 1222.5]|uniref:globin domain-containing protein n=1 Tax=Streptomyces sp. 1222.5 TaxID=1881026 RepID=UPI003EBC4FFD